MLHQSSGSNDGQRFAYTALLYAVCVLSPAKVENLEDIWICFLLFFEPSIITTRCSGIVWILKPSLQKHAFPSSLFTRSFTAFAAKHSFRSSLSSYSFSVCFTSVLTWSWKRAWSLSMCLFGLFLSLRENIFLYLNLNLTLLFVLTREHASKYMHVYVMFSLFTCVEIHVLV